LVHDSLHLYTILTNRFFLYHFWRLYFFLLNWLCFLLLNWLYFLLLNWLYFLLLNWLCFLLLNWLCFLLTWLYFLWWNNLRFNLLYEGFYLFKFSWMFCKTILYYFLIDLRWLFFNLYSVDQWFRFLYLWWFRYLLSL
jgi:hypothetical protein